MTTSGAATTHDSHENVKIAQDAGRFPATEPSKPARSEVTSVAKSAGHNSAFKSPISAVRSGDRWGSHTRGRHPGSLTWHPWAEPSAVALVLQSRASLTRSDACLSVERCEQTLHALRSQ